MTKITTPTYDLVEIERQARQMRAEMLTSALRRAAVWLRKPRLTSVKGHTRAA